MDTDVLTTRVVDGIAVITLGSSRRIYIDQETSDALFEALNKCAGDANIRVVIVTGAAAGSFVRHYPSRPSPAALEGDSGAARSMSHD